VDEYIDHIDHVAELTGSTDNIGVSTDMSIGTYPDHEQDPWGAPELPGVSRLYGRHVTPDIRSPRRNLNGFSDYAEVTNLIEGLDRRGYKDADIGKFLGGNLLRVFEKVWGRSN
jgi:membrane dipeptidase